MIFIIVNIIIVFSTNGSKKQEKISNEIMKKIKLNQKEKKRKKKTSKKYTNIQHETDGEPAPPT